MRSDPPTGTVTFLFTDVEGWTKRLRELGAPAFADAEGMPRDLTNLTNRGLGAIPSLVIDGKPA